MIIGITGTHGAGKGAVVSVLTKMGYKHISVSDFLADESEKRGLGRDRYARGNMANVFRSEKPTRVMELLFEQVQDTENTVIEALHTVGEVNFVKEKGGIVFAIDADLKTRYDRIYSRGSEKDNVSFEEFQRYQNVEMQNDDPNINNLKNSIEAADYKILNNGNIEELREEIERIIKEVSQG